MDRGASANMVAMQDGNTPLHKAVILNLDISFFQLLLDQGGDVTLKNAEGETPLQLAEKEHASDNIKNMLSNDDINCKLKIRSSF